MTQKNNSQGVVRIIGGQWRSRKIIFPATTALRPTPDRIRETVFNWLAPYIVDATCLDLFAGSGALGFEALSRGAKHVTFVDADPIIITHLKETLEKLKSSNATVLQAQVPQLTLTPQFSIVFLDPPFHKNLLAPTCDWLQHQNLLASNALIYLEAEHKLDLKFLPSNWTILKNKSAGQVDYYLVVNN